MLRFLPIRKMWERVEIARQDSDTALFFHLLYAGEMLIKLVTAGLVGAVLDDRDRHRYRLLHRLIRADGLGDWPQALDDVLTGTASHHTTAEAQEDQRDLSQRMGQGHWQHEAVRALASVVSRCDPAADLAPAKASVRHWFRLFVQLRNKTRGHGAPTPALCNSISKDLEASICLVQENLRLLQRPWAYLHRNLSGKYRVIALAGNCDCFAYLKSASHAKSEPLEAPTDGVHIHFGFPAPVELIETNIDAADFFFPNGSFNGHTYELISYITDNRVAADAGPYLAPAGQLPRSETEGLSNLDVIGEVFTNIPPKQHDYVPRPVLEKQLHDVLSDDRHPVVTLVGRGGIGKTSLAVTALHEISQSARFEVVLWFSARDIDLLPEGPKAVSPRILTEKDIAAQLVDLLTPGARDEKGFDALGYFAETLTKSPFPQPILFVFDNFETVRSPIDLFNWLSARIRLPNKVLITTRQRDFKADYPIEVSGMTEDEANELVNGLSGRLGVREVLTEDYRERLYDESAGHPYIIKVLLGEVAKARRLVKVERIVAGKEEMLDALFERTYAGLSPAGKRVFLTLCRWRSMVPELALEAILLRPGNEKMDVEEAVEELMRSSFVDSMKAQDDTTFLDVPLVASVFGRRKLEVSVMKAAIEVDVQLLQVIGATQESGLRHGMRPRIQNLFQYVSGAVNREPGKLDEYVPILEFICRQFPAAWLMLADLYEESGLANAVAKAKEATRRLLERASDMGLRQDGWERLEGLCQRTQDWPGEVQAILGYCKLPGVSFGRLSKAANRLNELFRDHMLDVDSEEKRIIIEELVGLMAARAGEASATDLSRLAWLCLNLHDEDRAREYTEQGLRADAQNIYCIKLAQRLGID